MPIKYLIGNKIKRKVAKLDYGFYGYRNKKMYGNIYFI